MPLGDSRRKLLLIFSILIDNKVPIAVIHQNLQIFKSFPDTRHSVTPVSSCNKLMLRLKASHEVFYDAARLAINHIVFAYSSS